MGAVGLQALAGQGHEAAAVVEAGEDVAFGGREAALGDDDAGGPQTAFLQPDAAPDGGLGVAHAQARGHGRAGRLGRQEILHALPVLGRDQSHQGGGGAFGGQRAEAQGAGGADQAQTVPLRLPAP